MDQRVRQFRTAAARENRGRRGLQRRYSPSLQSEAARYWRARREAGEPLRDVAAALGVAPWSLRRWAKRWATAARFTPVQVVASPAPAVPLTVVLTATGPRVDGLDVETAARLLALLR